MTEGKTMKIGVMGNSKKIRDEQILVRFIRFLQSEGYETICFENVGQIGGVDVIVVLGGDGAILHAATAAAQKNIKIIGINYGTLGFLTEYEKEETEKIRELLVRLKESNCPVLKRTLLETELDGKKYYALNEVSFQRDYSVYNTQLAKLKVKVNQREMEKIAGDGLLISTPTGSTAYSLSAGGAILAPDVPAFMLTPICAFSLNTRPMVFPDTDVFEVMAVRKGIMLLVDGKQAGPIQEGTEIIVRKAPFTADFPVRDDSCFFRKIRTKLNQ
jgi:probable inorganic polyphosphate/ATP-NAD kinase